MDKTFVKGLNMIETLVASDGPRGVASLSREMKLTKSNVHRLLTTLVSCGYVHRTSFGEYELNSKLWELGVQVRSRLGLLKVSREPMTQLAERTGESVQLCVLEGLEVVYVDKVDSRQAIVAQTTIGGRGPAWSLATGKAMLAYRPDALASVSSPLQVFTASTITDQALLSAELKKVRQRGYAVNRGEWRKEVYGIAAPIWDEKAGIAGAIGISGPGTRFSAKQIDIWAEMIVQSAQAISRALGSTVGSRATELA